MARATAARSDLTQTWIALATSGQTFILSVLSGVVYVAWSASAPAVGAVGHKFREGDTFGDTLTTANVWIRADVTAVIVVTTE